MDTGASWELLLECLEQVTASDFQQPFGKRTVRKWADRVTRHSFSVQLMDRK